MSSDVVQGVEKSWAETPPMNPPLRHAIGKVVERLSAKPGLTSWPTRFRTGFSRCLVNLGNPTAK